MILVQHKNAPVCAPQTIDFVALLSAYKAWSGKPDFSNDEMYLFMTTPGIERTEFLQTLAISAEIVTNSYATQTYTV
jgi:hypothetical protein